jgi:hypothetical protein
VRGSRGGTAGLGRSPGGLHTATPHKTVIDLGKLPGGELGGSPDPVVVPARLLAPVEADATGCEGILGLGVPARWALPRFWRALGAAMRVLRPGESDQALYRLFAGRLPGA